MAYITINDAAEAFQQAYQSRPLTKAAEFGSQPAPQRVPIFKSASLILKEAAAAVKPTDRFDVFLSHCLKDAEKILGVKAYIERQGLSVYVDWIDDPQLDRANVTAATADRLRVRMEMSLAMLFATSDNSPNSKWMPWELGYFDGLRKGRVAIFPLLEREGAAFDGQQYLGLYPKIENLPNRGGEYRLYVTKGVGTKTWLTLEDFKNGKSGFKSY